MFNIFSHHSNAETNYLESYLTLVRMPIIKKSNVTNAGEQVKVKKPLFLVSRTAEWYTYYGNYCEDSSIRQNRHVPAIPFLGLYAKDSMSSYRDIYSSVLSVLSRFTKAKEWNQAICRQTDG